LAARRPSKNKIEITEVAAYPLEAKAFDFLSLSLPTGFSDLHVRFGSYELRQDDVQSVSAHAERIFRLKEPSMETACRRLADAGTRHRAEDQIIDAVIGIEALLLNLERT
jgi:hypothetical protein